MKDDCVGDFQKADVGKINLNDVDKNVAELLNLNSLTSTLNNDSNCIDASVSLSDNLGK